MARQGEVETVVSILITAAATLTKPGRPSIVEMAGVVSDVLMMDLDPEV